MFYMARQSWRAWVRFRTKHALAYHLIMICLMLVVATIGFAIAWDATHYMATHTQCQQQGTC